MAIVTQCNDCKQQYKVPEQFAGKRVKCKKCGARFTVPAPEPVEADSPGESDQGQLDNLLAAEQHALTASAGPVNTFPLAKPVPKRKLGLSPGAWMIVVGGLAVTVLLLLIAFSMLSTGTETPPRGGTGVAEAGPPAAPTERGQSAVGGLPSAGSGHLLRIPLLIQPSRQPGYGWEAGAENVKGALNEALDRGAETDIVAIRDAAKLAGEMAGFDFEPLSISEDGEKPIDSVRQFPEEAPAFLFMRCSGIFRPLGPMGTSAIIRVDHALIGRADLDVLEADNWFHIKPGSSPPLLAKAFVEGFGWRVLAPMQQRFMKEEIAAAVARIRAEGSPRTFTSTVEPTRGIAELALVFKGPGRCDVYFQKNEALPFRKCALKPGVKADGFGKLPAGNWKLYAEIWPEDAATPRCHYCDAFSAKDGERYTVEFPGPAG